MASAVLAMWITLLARTASVRGAGIRTGDSKSVVSLSCSDLDKLARPILGVYTVQVPFMLIFQSAETDLVIYRPGGGKVRPTLPFSSNVQVAFH